MYTCVAAHPVRLGPLRRGTTRASDSGCAWPLSPLVPRLATHGHSKKNAVPPHSNNYSKRKRPRGGTRGRHQASPSAQPLLQPRLPRVSACSAGPILSSWPWSSPKAPDPAVYSSSPAAGAQRGATRVIGRIPPIMDGVSEKLPRLWAPHKAVRAQASNHIEVSQAGGIADERPAVERKWHQA